MLKSAFGPAQIVYSCDRDQLEPLPALIDEEFYEPRCAEFTIVKFPQMIEGVPFVTRSMLAVFDKKDRLIAVQGEYVGGLSPEVDATVSEEQAAVGIEAKFDADPGSLAYSKAELQYRYRDGIVPVWSFQGVTANGRRYAEMIVDADSGEVIATDTGIDHDPGDIDVWGYTLDDEAAYLCNEPALRKRRARTSFSSGTNRRAFNDNIHVYDLQANPDYPRGGGWQGDLAVQTVTTNDVHLVFWKKFNYRCNDDAPEPTSCTQGFTPCDNDDAVEIDDWDISTFTAFVHANNAFDYVTSMGFDKEGGDYPDGHSLAVIVNKTGEGMIGEQELCDGPGSCSTARGFPVLNDATAYNDYVPWWTGDRYDFNDPGDLHPTLVIEGNTRYCRSSAGQYSVYRAMNHPVLYHEFYHYVVRRYFNDRGYIFNLDEDLAINEGLAKFFAVTMEDMSPDNFHHTQLLCNSDDNQGGDSMNMNYQKTTVCCMDEHDGGMVLTQALWDLREGIGSGVTALGKDYTDLLAFAATVLLSGGEDWTLTEFRTLLADAATYLLAGDCPLGSYTQCVNDINAAFGNHGVCTIPCIYPDRDCGPETPDYCDDATCFRTTSCTGAPDLSACAKSGNELLCCAEVCSNDEVVACGLYATSALCRTDCTANLWSQELRDCLEYDLAYPGDCDACDALM